MKWCSGKKYKRSKVIEHLQDTLEILPAKIIRRDFYVYLHRRNDTGQVFYVGKGCGRRAFTLNGRNTYWKNIVKKYGFSPEVIIKRLTENQAFELEKYYIQKYKKVSNSICNLTDGGDGNSGFKLTEEQKNKIRISAMGNLRCVGRVMKQETKDKISKANKGENHPLYGKPCSEVHKRKISSFHKGKKLSVETKLKMSEAAKDKTTYNFINTNGTIFSGTREQICEVYKLDPAILKVLFLTRKKVKTTCGGWSLVEDAPSNT